VAIEREHLSKNFLNSQIRLCLFYLNAQAILLYIAYFIYVTGVNDTVRSLNRFLGSSATAFELRTLHAAEWGDELATKWDETVEAYFQVLSSYSPRGTEVNYENLER
jgi:hypothetical protein